MITVRMVRLRIMVVGEDIGAHPDEPLAPPSVSVGLPHTRRRLPTVLKTRKTDMAGGGVEGDYALNSLVVVNL
jgi:hypothetical protein